MGLPLKAQEFVSFYMKPSILIAHGSLKRESWRIMGYGTPPKSPRICFVLHETVDIYRPWIAEKRIGLSQQTSNRNCKHKVVFKIWLSYLLRFYDLFFKANLNM